MKKNGFHHRGELPEDPGLGIRTQPVAVRLRSRPLAAARFGEGRRDAQADCGHRQPRRGEKARALIAAEDGTVSLYTVGGLATTHPASPEAIVRTGEVRVGLNPVCLAYQKFAPDTVIAVSCGDRELAWIRYGEAGAEVIRRLRDARLRDPVFAESADTHGIETSLLTVADFKGRKILNYRFSTLVFATQGGAKFGMGPDGKDEFECGGVLEFPGSPFCISATSLIGETSHAIQTSLHALKRPESDPSQRPQGDGQPPESTRLPAPMSCATGSQATCQPARLARGLATKELPSQELRHPYGQIPRFPGGSRN